MKYEKYQNFYLKTLSVFGGEIFNIFEKACFCNGNEYLHRTDSWCRLFFWASFTSFGQLFENSGMGPVIKKDKEI